MRRGDRFIKMEKENHKEVVRGGVHIGVFR